jgi:hypothetical protein
MTQEEHTGNRERESERLLKQGFSFFLSSTFFFFFFFLRTYDATLHRIEKRLNGFHMLENSRTRVLSTEKDHLCFNRDLKFSAKDPRAATATYLCFFFVLFLNYKRVSPEAGIRTEARVCKLVS